MNVHLNRVKMVVLVLTGLPTSAVHVPLGMLTRTAEQVSRNTNEQRHEKPVFCICENKDADQLRGNRTADQHLCFRYKDSTIHLFIKSKISSL